MMAVLPPKTPVSDEGMNRSIGILVTNAAIFEQVVKGQNGARRPKPR